MALSEQERRTLEELEAQLSADDPKFASAMLADPARIRRRRRAFLSVALVLAGLAVVVTGVLTELTALGALGFVIIMVGLLFAVTSPTPRQQPQFYVLDACFEQHGPRGGVLSSGHGLPGATRVGRPGIGTAARVRRASPRSPRPQGDFMARMEERWDRRRRESQGW